MYAVDSLAGDVYAYTNDSVAIIQIFLKLRF